MTATSVLWLALVYLTAGVIAVAIAQRLGLGSVLGYLIAGAVIGPFALHLVGDQTGVMHFAEFGIVIMLFLIGLEVQPSVLWRMRTVFLGLGGVQILATGAVLAAAGVALGLDWRAALAVGFILALSSTAIVLQTFEEKGLRHTSAGTAAFGILLFQDVSTIPMFAALPLLTLGTPRIPSDVEHASLANFPAGIQAVAILAAIFLIVGVGRYLMRPAFRIIADTRSREIFTATALLLVIAVALLMEAVGLSAALGAFLAGVVLADSEFRREIESDIEPFRGLLLGLFFISVGAGIDLGLIGSEPTLLTGYVVGLMVIKAAVIYVVARAFRVEARSAGMAAVALAQGGEFAFVLLGIASRIGIISADISALTIAAVAISMALTPLALLGYQRLYVQRLSSAPEPQNDDFHQRPDVIVAGFGRFGQIVARLLIVNNFKTSTLDSSADQVELVRRFGRRVYYGDATRLDLLRASGAAEAKLLIVAIDDRDRAEKLVDIAARHFPNLKILARAYDRRHAYRLLDKGAHVVERETFEAGLTLGAEALKILGFKELQATRAARLFRRHDEKMFEALAAVWADEERYIVATKETSDRMNELLAADIRNMLEESDKDPAIEKHTR